MSSITPREAVLNELDQGWQNLSKNKLSTRLTEKCLTSQIVNAYKDENLNELNINELHLIKCATEIESTDTYFLTAFVAMFAVGFFSAFIGAQIGHGPQTLSLILGPTAGALMLGALALYKFVCLDEYEREKEIDLAIELKNLTLMDYIKEKIGQDPKELDLYDLSNRISEAGLTKLLKTVYKDKMFDRISELDLKVIRAVYETEKSNTIVLMSVLAFLTIGCFAELVSSQISHNQLLSIIFGSSGALFALSALAVYVLIYQKEKKILLEAEMTWPERDQLGQDLALLRAFNPHELDLTHPSLDPDPPKNLPDDLEPKNLELHENNANRGVRINYYLAWLGAIAALSVLFCAAYDPTLADILPGSIVAGTCALSILGNYLFRIYPEREKEKQIKSLV